MVFNLVGKAFHACKGALCGTRRRNNKKGNNSGHHMKTRSQTKANENAFKKLGEKRWNFSRNNWANGGARTRRNNRR